MSKLVIYSTDAKRCAKQIVTDAFPQILLGDFRIPTQTDMEQALKGTIDFEFDEYKMRSEIKAKHPGWDKERLKSEVYKAKMKYDKKYQNNLRQAASEAISEIESLISSLNDAIKAWKIKNLR